MDTEPPPAALMFYVHIAVLPLMAYLIAMKSRAPDRLLYSDSVPSGLRGHYTMYVRPRLLLLACMLC